MRRHLAQALVLSVSEAMNRAYTAWCAADMSCTDLGRSGYKSVERYWGRQAHSVTVVSSAVRIIHKPTGSEAICQEHTSQLRNKDQVLEELRVKVREYALLRCAKCNEHRPNTDYLCERCRKLLDAVYCRDAKA